jgi:hypothetical protein
MFWRSFLHIMLILWRNLLSNKSMDRYNGPDLCYICFESLPFPFEKLHVRPELRLVAFGYAPRYDISLTLKTL